MNVRVSAVITERDAVLPIRHRRRGVSYWAFPGGRLEHGGTTEDCLKREVREETGLEVRMGPPLLVADVIPAPGSSGEQDLNLVFCATPCAGTLTARPQGPLAERHDRAQFVPIASLAELDLRPDPAARIAAAHAEGFHAPSTYVGNLW